jgi:hypothetical protein
MVGSEQHLKYNNPYLRGARLATALDMSRGTKIKLRTAAEGYNQSRELERYGGYGSDASRGARG